tara:strand:- start:186 stop:323 length:138 start_codon:yes stop_codon:yes gene_type:complete
MKRKELVQLGIGVALGLLIAKVIKLGWIILTAPLRLTLGHTDWYK